MRRTIGPRCSTVQLHRVPIPRRLLRVGSSRSHRGSRARRAREGNALGSADRATARLRSSTGASVMNFSGFNRRQPFKSRKGSMQSVGDSRSGRRGSSGARFGPPRGRAPGHWFDGRWYPAAAGQASAGRPGGRDRSGAGGGRRRYSQGNSYDGDLGYGLERRIGNRL